MTDFLTWVKVTDNESNHLGSETNHLVVPSSFDCIIISFVYFHVSETGLFEGTVYVTNRFSFPDVRPGGSSD